MLTVLIILLVLAVIFGGWGGPHYGWGYAGSWSPVGIILVILLLWLAFGHR